MGLRTKCKPELCFFPGVIDLVLTTRAEICGGENRCAWVPNLSGKLVNFSLSEWNKPRLRKKKKRPICKDSLDILIYITIQVKLKTWCTWYCCYNKNYNSISFLAASTSSSAVLRRKHHQSILSRLKSGRNVLNRLYKNSKEMFSHSIKQITKLEMHF